MLEQLLIQQSNLSSFLFDFNSASGIEGSTWTSERVPTLSATCVTDTPINVTENGVAIDGTYTRRLLMNKTIEPFINTFVVQGYINPGAKGRVGAIVGNYSNTPNRNLEIYYASDPRIYVYGPPGEFVFTPKVPVGEPFRFGITTNFITKMYELYINGELVQTGKFAYAIPKLRTPLYIGGDTRNGAEVTFKGALSRIVGLSTYQPAEVMERITLLDNESDWNIIRG